MELKSTVAVSPSFPVLFSISYFLVHFLFHTFYIFSCIYLEHVYPTDSTNGQSSTGFCLFGPNYCVNPSIQPVFTDICYEDKSYSKL